MLELMKLIFSGLLGGLVAAYVSERGHRNKNTWEWKFQVYKDVIGSLFDMRGYFISYVGCYLDVSGGEEGTLPSNFETTKYHDGYEKLYNSIKYGGLLFPDEIKNKLDTLLEHVSPEFDLKDINRNDYEAFITSRCTQIDECLTLVIEHSRVELKLNYNGLSGIIKGVWKFLKN